MQVDGQYIAEVRAEHDQDALGDVDNVQHTEDQRQPDRHQCIDTAAQDAVDDRLAEFASHLRFMPFILLTGCVERAASLADPLDQVPQAGFCACACACAPALPPSTGTNWPFCHWKIRPCCAVFSPLAVNCTAPCTVCSLIPLCR